MMLFDGKRDAEVLDLLRVVPDECEFLVAAHLLRGLALLRTGKLQDALAEHAALSRLDPKVADFLDSCYQIPTELRQTLETDLPASPLAAEQIGDAGRRFEDLRHSGPSAKRGVLCPSRELTSGVSQNKVVRAARVKLGGHACSGQGIAHSTARSCDADIDRLRPLRVRFLTGQCEAISRG